MKKKKQIKKDRKELTTIKKEMSDFKTFISRGNVVDMAVGVIIGGAFGKIVSSLVNDVLMPLLGIVLGGLNFNNLKINVGEASITYGVFLQTIIDFLIISFSIFMMIKLFEKFKKKEKPKIEEEKKSEEVLLLEEIRDLLKKQKGNRKD